MAPTIRFRLVFWTSIAFLFFWRINVILTQGIHLVFFDLCVISTDCAGMVSQMTITTTTSGGQQLTQTIIPKAQMSLKVLAELPLITVLFYQLYKNQVHKIIGDLFPIVTKSLSHQPPKRNPLVTHFLCYFFLEIFGEE